MDKRLVKLRSLTTATRSLQFKATVLVVVLTSVVTASVSSFLMKSSAELFRDQHGSQMIQVAAMLAKAATPRLAAGDISALQALADETAQGQSLLYVVFSDVAGRQLAVAQRSDSRVLQQLGRDVSGKAPVPGQPVFHAGTDSNPVYLDVTYPITDRGAVAKKTTPERGVDGAAQLGRGGSRLGQHSAGETRLLGYVRAGMVAGRWDRTMASRVDLLVGVSVLALAAVIPLGFLLVRRIVSPLDGLAGVMGRFSRGQLDVRSPVKRRDEVGRLAEAFNRMADEHQRTHERVVRLNAELEKRVTQRTQQLRELASREPLTGLYNRRSFNEMMKQRLSEARRYGSPLSCIMIDLDGFKRVNDAFGHQSGDDLLVLTAGLITGQLRTSDVVARFGGDEFIVLLPQTDADQARVLAERIRTEFAAGAADRLPQLPVTMSVGIASVPCEQVTDAESLIRAADHAMYDAKAAGKNRTHVAGAAAAPTSA